MGAMMTTFKQKEQFIIELWLDVLKKGFESYKGLVLSDKECGDLFNLLSKLRCDDGKI